MSEDVQEQILHLISQQDDDTPINTLSIASTLGHDHQLVVGCMNSLLTHDDIIRSELVSSKRLDLTSEGHQFVAKGSHEAQVYAAVPVTGGITQADLFAKITDPSVDKKNGFNKAMAAGWIILDKGSKLVSRKVATINDTVSDLLSGIAGMSITDLPDPQKADLKKRKLITESVIKSYDIKKGVKFTTRLSKLETEITADMLAKGSWRDLSFKEYNFHALGAEPESMGHLHPLLKVRSEFRQIFLEMGFQEMPTNNWIESSFWNFDALFVPQQHPARDDHDTFFLSQPEATDLSGGKSDVPREYLDKVRKVHTSGDYGSIGYQSDWNVREASKNVLRTHTTACSARMLYKLAQEWSLKCKSGDDESESIFPGAKYFSIDRVFRNETLDATHLAEFHQIEGVVAGVDIGLADLMGVVREFFSKMGLSQIKFKAAYNPYTEPSMEVFAFHPGLKKWVEIGNSGIFRPEMLRPMGLPDNVSVLGFGLSCERPTMIKYGINNIRDLVGHKVDLQIVYDNPLCILTDA